MSPRERFGSRLGMMLVMLGMAVGTGNIWRFPRIAAQNGGGEFLIPWVAFLFLWSIPLLLVEFGMGRKVRAGPVVAFARLMGPGWAWMGAFVAFVAVGALDAQRVSDGLQALYTFEDATGKVVRDRSGSGRPSGRRRRWGSRDSRSRRSGRRNRSPSSPGWSRSRPP